MDDTIVDNERRIPDTPNKTNRTVRKRTLAEYMAAHPLKGMFPPTSQLATKIIMAICYLLILAAIVYIVLRATGYAG